MRNCFGRINKLMLNRFGCPKRVSSSLPHFHRFALNPRLPSTMPRKAAGTTAASGESSTEPRRSSRIKEQPKEETAPKKAAKPRAKKADKESADKEEKSKAPRGKKRKADEEANGTADDEEAPAEKKVRFFFFIVVKRAFLRHLM